MLIVFNESEIKENQFLEYTLFSWKFHGVQHVADNILAPTLAGRSQQFVATQWYEILRRSAFVTPIHRLNPPQILQQLLPLQQQFIRRMDLGEHKIFYHRIVVYWYKDISISIVLQSPQYHPIYFTQSWGEAYIENTLNKAHFSHNINHIVRVKGWLICRRAFFAYFWVYYDLMSWYHSLFLCVEITTLWYPSRYFIDVIVMLKDFTFTPNRVNGESIVTYILKHGSIPDPSALFHYPKRNRDRTCISR